MRLRFALCLLWVAAVCSCGQRGVPPRESIGNFGKVNDFLFRGAQPDEAGIESLKRLGVKLIVNLRMPDDGWKLEEAKAQACGIAYTNMPMGGLGRPNREEVERILALLETAPAPVFVHCQYGCDRTGTIIACYRIRHDQWSGAEALHEARRFGMSRFERGMAGYVEDFGKARQEIRVTNSK